MTEAQRKLYQTHYIEYRQQKCDFTVPRRYQHLEYKSGGAQGWVVCAIDTVLNRRVAIKKMRNPFVMEISAKRTYREFILLEAFKHPNIIELLNAFSPQTSASQLSEVYFVMELADFNLGHVIRDKRLPHPHLSFLVFQLLCAMKHLHKSGIIHRDLKPENIVVNEDVTLKILDFGLARRAAFDTQMRMTNYVVTRWYRAPEVILEMGYTDKVDVWSIGCIFAEVLTRKILFPGTDHLDQWRSIVSKMGSPPQSFVDKMSRHVAMFVRNQPRKEAKSFRELIPDEYFPRETEDPRHSLTADHARDLVEKMLAIDPDERISVDQALRHPYVAGWLKQHDVNLPITTHRYDDNIETEERSIAQWRVLIFNELERYKETHDVYGTQGTAV
ncbi:unnamed protein product, partial [Mesorhabditis belari]|uniref:Stress-activated protein kinase JNK n=1 Tax=Mesorhabditis belari TaxID=2138241 RepID=A0A915FAX8_9BILA